MSGLVLGTLILGVGGRLLMRGIALTAMGEVGFSAGGTLEVIAFGALVGMPSGIVFALLKPYLRSNPVVSGIGFGVLVFLAVLITPGDAKKAALGFPDLFPFIIGAFIGLFVIYGITLSWMVDRMNPPPPTTSAGQS